MKTTVEREQGKRRGDEAAEPGKEGGASGAAPARYLQRLQRTIGNYGVQRVVESRLAGGAGARIEHKLGAVREVRARDGAAMVQRDEEEGSADDGTVTILPPQSDPYDVSGTTLAELHSQLDPTEWGRCTYHYGYDYETTNGRATRVNITLTLTIRLPRWQEGRDDASAATRTEWDRMMGALRAHEERHAEIAREWAPTFKQRMLGVREGNLASRHSQVLGQVDQRQGQYDTQTTHGQTEGVSLDLSVDQEQAEGEAEVEVEE
jgi:predicted secreted Zn-dependent protease